MNIDALDIVTTSYDSSWGQQQLKIEGYFTAPTDGRYHFSVIVDLRQQDQLFIFEWLELSAQSDDYEPEDSELLRETMVYYTRKIRDRHRELMMQLVYESIAKFSDPVAVPKSS